MRTTVLAARVTPAPPHLQLAGSGPPRLRVALASRCPPLLARPLAAALAGRPPAPLAPPASRPLAPPAPQPLGQLPASRPSVEGPLARRPPRRLVPPLPHPPLLARPPPPLGKPSAAAVHLVAAVPLAHPRPLPLVPAQRLSLGHPRHLEPPVRRPLGPRAQPLQRLAPPHPEAPACLAPRQRPRSVLLIPLAPPPRLRLAEASEAPRPRPARPDSEGAAACSGPLPHRPLCLGRLPLRPLGKASRPPRHLAPLSLHRRRACLAAPLRRHLVRRLSPTRCQRLASPAPACLGLRTLGRSRPAAASLASPAPPCLAASRRQGPVGLARQPRQHPPRLRQASRSPPTARCQPHQASAGERLRL